MQKTVETDSEAYAGIVEVLEIEPEETEFEEIAAFACDDDDLAEQRDAGDADPIAHIEIVAHWSPEACQGTIDWYANRLSKAELYDQDDEDALEIGGELIGFFYEGEQPPLDAFVPAAIHALNEQIEWAEFTLD